MDEESRWNSTCVLLCFLSRDEPGLFHKRIIANVCHIFPHTFCENWTGDWENTLPPPAPLSLWMSITIGTHAASNRPSPPSIIFPSHPQNYSYHIRPEVLIPSLLEYMRLCQTKLTICRHCRPVLQLLFPSTFMSDKAMRYYRQQIFSLLMYRKESRVACETTNGYALFVQFLAKVNAHRKCIGSLALLGK